jgi:hypothetical protein
MIGIDHFIILDNNSSDNIFEVSDKFINAGFLTLLRFPHEIRAQMDGYQSVRPFLSAFDWVLVLDPDEFLDLKQYRSIQDYIDTFPTDVSAIQFPWLIYNYSGHVNSPEGLVTQSFTYINKPSTNVTFKSLTKVSALKSFGTPHHNDVTEGRVMSSSYVDLNKAEASKSNFDFDFSAPCVNHYYTKSFQEFQEKVNRGRSNSHKKLNIDKFSMKYGDTQYLSLYEKVPELKKYIQEFALHHQKPSIHGELSCFKSPIRDSFNSLLDILIFDSLLNSADVSFSSSKIIKNSSIKNVVIYPISDNLKKLSVLFSNSLIDNFFISPHFSEFQRKLKITKFNFTNPQGSDLKLSFYSRIYAFLFIQIYEADTTLSLNHNSEIFNIEFTDTGIFLVVFYLNQNKLVKSLDHAISFNSNRSSKVLSSSFLVRP